MWAGLGYYRRARFLLEVGSTCITYSPIYKVFSINKIKLFEKLRLHSKRSNVNTSIKMILFTSLLIVCGTF